MNKMKPMTFFLLFEVFAALFLSKDLFAQNNIELPFLSYPTPVEKPYLLFYIQRNKNSNTIVYEARINQKGEIDRKNPVNVYWVNYERKRQKQNLNWLERNFGYGVIPDIKDNEIWLKFVADKNRKFKVLQDENGNFCSYMYINEKWACLKKIYVTASETLLLPKVNCVEIFGIETETGKYITEKINF